MDFTNYKVVHKGEFAYNPSRINLGSIALRSGETCIISPMYVVFKLKSDEILPDFLNLYFARKEFQRSTLFYAYGSVRDTFSYDLMCNVRLPLPPLAKQRRLVAVYEGLKNLAEQNEALLPQLQNACHAFVVKCKMDNVECKMQNEKCKMVRLGEYIEECNEKNRQNIYGVSELQGVTSESKFDTSKANTNELDFTNYKIVHKGEFAYNPSRINLGSIALRSGETCIISPMYVVFKLKSDEILPEFLNLYFARKEFQRSTLFYAYGSVRDTFSFELMSNVLIPLPPLSVQQSIVNLYACMERAKSIAATAREQMKNLCPALIQCTMYNV